MLREAYDGAAGELDDRTRAIDAGSQAPPLNATNGNEKPLVP